jgi:hypothetical protein
VVHENGSREGKGIAFADLMPLEEFQVGLLGSLPLRDRLEGIDVPANHASQGLGAVLGLDQGRGVFELHLAMPGPCDRCSSMGKGLGLLVNHGFSLS